MAINGVASFDSTIPRVKAYPSSIKKYAVINVGQIDGCVGLLTDIDCTEKEKQSPLQKKKEIPQYPDYHFRS
jgi:hypothetical protein